jgi:dTDP-4-amino-4,6-dideoxygalactose transaminase
MNNIPFNDTSRLYNRFSEEINDALLSTASSGWWLLGSATAKFAQDFSTYMGIPYCLPVANGTDALEIAIRIVQQKKESGAEVITVANAGGYSTIACKLCDMTPVYADIDEETLLVDIDSIVRSLSDKTCAVILTHLFGAVVDVFEVRRVLDHEGYSHVKIIEDCAQAHGAELNRRKVGTLGDIATFSFYPTKNLGALGDAGAIVTADEAAYIKAKALQQYGWSTKYKVTYSGGRNSRMDELQAAVLSSLLPHLDALNKRRVQIYEKYASVGNSAIRFSYLSGRDFVAHLAVVRVERRSEFIKYLKENGIATDIHYPVLDDEQEAWSNKQADSNKVLSVSKVSVKKIVSLPCFPTMTDAEVDHVCNILRKWNG